MNMIKDKSLTNFQEILNQAKEYGRRKIVVAGAHNEQVIEAIHSAEKQGLVEPLLVGDDNKIKTILHKKQISTDAWPIYHADNDQDVASQAVELVLERGGQILMKGEISTPVLLKTVLAPQYRLRMDTLLSHIALMQIPTYSKLLMITDSGMVIRPDLDQKIKIIKNALDVFKKMRNETPRISILSANEKISEKLPETVDAVQLVELAKSGEFGQVVLEGPYALDVAFSTYAAEIKNIQSRVNGEPDMLLMPDVTCGNILAKGLVYLANAKICGLVVGAKIPIIIISRAEYAETWLNSIAFSSVLCEK